MNGQAKTIAATGKKISDPFNNNFVDFKMSYNGETKVMSITYGGQTWTEDVSSFIGTNQAMSFSIAASTGAQMNLQQLRNVNFTYTVAQGTVIANYVDEQGNTIAPSETTSGDINTPYTTSQKTIPGYTFKASNGATTSGNYAVNDQTVNYVYTRNQGTIDITYIDQTTGQTLSKKDLSGGTGDDSGYTTADTIKSYTDKGYELISDDYPKDGTKFADDPQHYIVRLKHGTVVETENKSVNEVIHYVYDNGDKAADNYKATIVFSRTITTDKVTGEKTYSDWTADNGGRFAAVLSPIIKDYIASQLKIDEMTGITVDTADIERIVVYHKVPAGIIVPPVHPDKPSQPSNNQSKTPTAKAVKDSKPTDVLPSTGDSQKSQIVLTLLGIMAVIISPLALLLRRRKQ
ncbi:LPXTG cell wall anchor domain-containing protein [Lactococcus lactis subsp. lactis]|nr:LPXTG cell wall anchor domain-containing protein [Lactococcus lactis]MCT0061551.1 LPXTG cell wall anchor domain-containing protein [Lactococcus lactis subsp. lactis]MCT0077187.1 LPXTG cell wall anchor domain-containing protein [Lactococcus lactis subsp. lactis]MCT0138043.1 LPXTG cell wall anchor domain-containing protein [Lactococcus lactis subsp. lactis]